MARFQVPKLRPMRLKVPHWPMFKAGHMDADRRLVAREFANWAEAREGVREVWLSEVDDRPAVTVVADNVDEAYEAQLFDHFALMADAIRLTEPGYLFVYDSSQPVPSRHKETPAATATA